MNFVLATPTSHQTTQYKAALNMWKLNSNYFVDFNSSTYKNQWKTLETFICDQVAQLPKVNPTLIKQIGKELREWLKYINNYTCKLYEEYFTIFLNETQLTAHGKIDITETVRRISVKNELTLIERFEIACTFCVADSVNYIWNQFPNGIKTNLINHFKLKTSADYEIKYIMISYWVNTAGVDYCTILKLIHMVINHRNQNALKYFWSILGNAEKFQFLTLCSVPYSLPYSVLSSILGQTVDSYGIVEITCFLLSQMSCEQVNSVLLSPHSCRFVNFLLSDWLYIEFYIPVVHKIFSSMNMITYHQILYSVASFLKLNSLHSDKVKLCFAVLWAYAPPGMKNLILLEETNTALCCLPLYHSQCSCLLNLMLFGESVRNVKKILFRCLLYTCKFTPRLLDWNYMEGLALKFITCSDVMVDFKKECRNIAQIIFCAVVHKGGEENFTKFCFTDTDEVYEFHTNLWKPLE